MIQHRRGTQRLRYSGLWAAALLSGVVSAAQLQWTEAQLVDRIKGGWLGKTAGGAIGGPYERLDPNQTYQMPVIDPDNVGNCGNDDVYVQVPFIACMDRLMGGAKGIYTATMQDYGTAFKNTTFNVWIGNESSRYCLQNGINPPYSGGQPLSGSVKNGNAEAIDWQIECQWIGFATPGMPATCAAINDSCGHVIGYADGVYSARLFVVMESIAPLHNDIHTVVKEAVKAIPTQSQIHALVDTLVWYHDKNPASSYWDCFQWAAKQAWYSGSFNGMFGSIQPAAIVTIGLLYGDGDILKTVEMVMRLGGDTDCNCGDVGAIVGSFLGYAKLPQAWRTALETGIAQSGGCSFSGTGVNGWNITSAFDATIRIAKKAIADGGGSAANGVYTINLQDIPPCCRFEKAGQNPISIPCTPTGTVAAAPSASSHEDWMKIAADMDGGLTIRFVVPQAAGGRMVSIDLLDTRGRVVRHLVCDGFPAGSHVVNIANVTRHDGCARALTAGHYIARLNIGEFEQTAMVMATP